MGTFEKLACVARAKNSLSQNCLSLPFLKTMVSWQAWRYVIAPIARHVDGLNTFISETGFGP